MVHWFKRHRQYLHAELQSLLNDPNYKQIHTARENLLVSHGNVLVRLDNTYRFPILIVYTEATPYVLPAIYPLTKQLTNEQVEDIARHSSGEVFDLIQPDIKYYYDLRHQNRSGNLCILEWDNVDDGSKFYGIKSILKRVKDWYKGTITGEFPPDSQETEFDAHFVHVKENIKLLYPEKFLDTALLEGEAYCRLLSFLPESKHYKKERKNYFGVLLTGIAKSGLYETLNFELPNVSLGEGIENALDLLAKRAVLEKQINEGMLIRLPWFQLEKEPNPFQTLNELIALVGNGEIDKGVSRMIPFFKDYVKFKPDNFHIAIRFPNRKGQQEFQMFEVMKSDRVTGILINANDQEAFRHFVDAYTAVYAIPCEKFTEESFHLRNSGRAERVILKEKAVNVVGVGALGSEVADSMAKAGIGEIFLIDNQVIKGPNPVRHLAGLESIGLPKVEAVAKILADHNPFAHIKMHGTSITSVDINDFFYDDSVTISSIADDNTEGYLNERAVVANKTVFYARALRGGKAARIFRVVPGKDACFHCLELYKRDKREITLLPNDETLPTLANECNNPIRPASAADLKFIAALTSRLIIDELQGGNEYNHWIWSSEKLDNLEPFQIVRQYIAPHPHCFYCNHEKKVVINLPASVLAQMQQLIAENSRVETGGVLAGHFDDHDNFIITHASGPGPKAIKTPKIFKKDIEFCQKFLDDLYVSSDRKTLYIGEWHSHPNSNNKPSGTDLNSLEQIAFQKEYLIDNPLMIIFTQDGKPSGTIHPAGKLYYFADIKITE